MDAKLKKLFEKAGQTARTEWISDEFCQDVAANALKGTDHLLSIPPGLGKTTAGLKILSAALEHVQPVWYIAPSDALTPYKTVLIKNALAGFPLSIMGPRERQIQDAPVVIWSVPMLVHCLTMGLTPWPEPALMVLDDAEYLGASKGSAMETLVLLLPVNVPLVLLISPTANVSQILDWVQTLRERPCSHNQPEFSPVPKVPAFISANGEMSVLFDKKRLSGRVRRILSEETRFPGFGPFVKGLLALLKTEDLLPAAILFPEESDCDHALEVLPLVKGEKSRGILTEPSIAAFLESHPFLKDYEPLNSALSKQAAAFHGGHHPLFGLLVEYLVSFRVLDLVLGELGELEKLASRVRTVVLYLPGSESSETKDRGIPMESMNRLIRLAGRPGTDPNGCIALAQAPRVDAVSLKDQILAVTEPLFLRSHYQADCPTVLALLTLGPDLAATLEKTLFFAQTRPLGEFCLKSLNEQLSEDLLKAPCMVHIKTVQALFDLRVNIEIQIQRISTQLKDRLAPHIRKELMEEKARKERTLMSLPCEKCEHTAACRRRGSRRMRKMIEEYEQMRDLFRKSRTGLKDETDFWMKVLAAFDYVDSGPCLTPKGRLALQTGMALPFGLVECLEKHLVPEDGAETRFALLAGFVSTKRPLSMDLTEDFEAAKTELTSLEKGFDPILEEVQERLLRYGILPPTFSFKQSCLMWAWKQGRDPQTLSRLTSLSIGAIISLIQQTTMLEERLRGF